MTGNKVFVMTSTVRTSGDDIMLAIGQRKHARRVWLTDEQAYTLACKLMSLSRGGSTDYEKLELGKDFGQ